MKIVILGGYGVFGSRLAELLSKDGHNIWLAGRNPKKAQKFALKIGAEILQADRSKNLSPIFSVSPDIVVDAAGPFQAYGDAP